MKELFLASIDSLLKSYFLEHLPTVTALDTTVSPIPLAPR